MENLSRSLLSALACALAGPLAAMGAIHLAVGAVVDEVVLRSDDLAAVLSGMFLAGLVLVAVGTLAGAAATVAALVLSGTPHPGWATLAVVLLTAAWSQVVGTLAVGPWPTALLLGVVPGMVRLLDDLTAGAAPGPTPTPGR